MDLQTAKLDVRQKIMNVKKDSLISKINDFSDQEMTVAYSADGTPLTKKTYNDRLEESAKQIIRGESINQEDLETESENW